MRIHLKMLVGDFLTFETKAAQSGGSPLCKLCPSPAPVESLNHIIASCQATSDIRERILTEMDILVKPKINFQSIRDNSRIL